MCCDSVAVGAIGSAECSDSSRMTQGIAMERHPAVYIVTNRAFGALYIGVSSNLPARIWHHKNNVVEGFTRTHQLHRLVWYEMHSTMDAAITREKQLKHWKRNWKVRLIIERNPSWRDLWTDIL